MNVLTGTTSAGMGSTVIMLVLMIAIFYFMLIRPENKRKKDEVGADVDGRIARTHQFRQVVDILRGRGITSDAEPLPKKEQPAHGPQIAFERQGPVEYFVDQGLHQFL